MKIIRMNISIVFSFFQAAFRDIFELQKCDFKWASGIQEAFEFRVDREVFAHHDSYYVLLEAIRQPFQLLTPNSSNIISSSCKL